MARFTGPSTSVTKVLVNGANGVSGQVLTSGGTGATTWSTPGAGAAWTKVEIDFGTMPAWDMNFTITDSGCSPTSTILVSPCGTVATGRVGNDWAWDSLNLVAIPGTGSFTLTAIAVPGPVVGKRTVQYQIG